MAYKSAEETLACCKDVVDYRIKDIKGNITGFVRTSIVDLGGKTKNEVDDVPPYMQQEIIVPQISETEKNEIQELLDMQGVDVTFSVLARHEAKKQYLKKSESMSDKGKGFLRVKISGLPTDTIGLDYLSEIDRILGLTKKKSKK